MIIIAGKVDLNPEKREAALTAGCPHMEATRAQKGCLDYVWSADLLVPGRVYVYERWQSQEDLAAHLAGPHYRAMLQTIASHEICGMDVAKFKISLDEPVYDPQGRARADFFTEDA